MACVDSGVGKCEGDVGWMFEVTPSELIFSLLSTVRDRSHRWQSTLTRISGKDSSRSA